MKHTINTLIFYVSIYNIFVILSLGMNLLLGKFVGLVEATSNICMYRYYKELPYKDTVYIV